MTNLFITVAQRDSLVQYLQTRPFAEVYQAIPQLMGLPAAPEDGSLPKPESTPAVEPEADPKAKPTAKTTPSKKGKKGKKK